MLEAERTEERGRAWSRTHDLSILAQGCITERGVMEHKQQQWKVSAHTKAPFRIKHVTNLSAHGSSCMGSSSYQWCSCEVDIMLSSRRFGHRQQTVVPTGGCC